MLSFNSCYHSRCNLKFLSLCSTKYLYRPKDIQECATNTDNCHGDANCTNTKGSFYCTCHHGYTGDGVTCNGE